MLVAVRLRPLNKREIDSGIRSCCEVINDSSVIAITKQGNGGYLKSEQTAINEYQYDICFDENVSQKEVYEGTAMKFIPNLMSGLNVTVFCYGATGSGKTHTMLGSTRQDAASSHAEAGIIPNAVIDLFNQIDVASSTLEYKEKYIVGATYIEVYNEQVYDLLEPTGKILSLREDAFGNVNVAGVTEQKVSNYDEVMDLLINGNKNRRTESTDANSVSSRSHAVLQLTLQHTSRSPSSGKDVIIESKLSLIDLAGSERASATNNRGARLLEGANINKSLLSLANCINALSSSNPAVKKTVKYRDSKLTHLLKSSLEGNCNLVMIANINPSHTTYEDSHNTLKYANRAKSLKVNPMIKENAMKELNWVEREAKLVSENKFLRHRVSELEIMVENLYYQLHPNGNNPPCRTARSSSVTDSVIGGNEWNTARRSDNFHMSISKHDHNNEDDSKRQDVKSVEQVNNDFLSDSILEAGLFECGDNSMIIESDSSIVMESQRLSSIDSSINIQIKTRSSIDSDDNLNASHFNKRKHETTEDQLHLSSSSSSSAACSAIKKTRIPMSTMKSAVKKVPLLSLASIIPQSNETNITTARDTDIIRNTVKVVNDALPSNITSEDEVEPIIKSKLTKKYCQDQENMNPQLIPTNNTQDEVGQDVVKKTSRRKSMVDMMKSIDSMLTSVGLPVVAETTSVTHVKEEMKTFRQESVAEDIQDDDVTITVPLKTERTSRRGGRGSLLPTSSRRASVISNDHDDSNGNNINATSDPYAGGLRRSKRVSVSNAPVSASLSSASNRRRSNLPGSQPYHRLL